MFLFVAAQKIAPILMVSVNRISSFCLSSSHFFGPVGYSRVERGRGPVPPPGLYLHVRTAHGLS